MTTYTNTTRVTSTTTPSQFSLKYFEKILMHMQRTIYFDEEMRHMPHHDPVEVACAGEAPADAWVATEEAAFAFLRAHSGATAVPLLTETAKHLVSLLDIETEDHPTLSETMEDAIARRSKAAPSTKERRLLDRAVPLLFSIASLQAAYFERQYAENAA